MIVKFKPLSKISSNLLPGTSYQLVTSGSSCPSGSQRIDTFEECAAAAVALGLTDTTATRYNYIQIDPPGCFFQSDDYLLFNPDETDTGDCSSYEKCICKTGKR